MRAAQVPGVKVTHKRDPISRADQFLLTFGKPPRTLVCECERSTDTTLGQPFQLVSGPEIAHLIADPANRLTRLLKENRTNDQILEDLYLAALTRPPTSSELATF